MKIVEFKTHQKEIFQFYEEKIYQSMKNLLDYILISWVRDLETLK